MTTTAERAAFRRALLWEALGYSPTWAEELAHGRLADGYNGWPADERYRVVELVQAGVDEATAIASVRAGFRRQAAEGYHPALKGEIT